MQGASGNALPAEQEITAYWPVSQKEDAGLSAGLGAAQTPTLFAAANAQ